MAKPDPQGGLVIRYDYLWVSEEGRGREVGAKVRPCAVVVAIPATDKALYIAKHDGRNCVRAKPGTKGKTTS